MKDWFRLMMMLAVIAIFAGSVTATIVARETSVTSISTVDNDLDTIALHLDSVRAIVLYHNTTSYAFVEMLDDTECYCSVRTAIRLNAAISGTSKAQFEILVNSDGEKEIVVKQD